MLDKLLGRPVSVTMVLLVFVVLGIIGIGKLPVSLIPDVDIPYVTVQVTASGMSASELDKTVVKPLRQSLVQTGHLKDIKSEAKDGNATITLTLEEGQDVDFFYIEVNEKIDRAMSSLPKIDRPKVFKASATDIPSFYINITPKGSGEDFMRISDLACDVISKRMEQLPEVAMVDISGFSEREILVIPDDEALTRLGISLSDFEKSISAANVSLSNLTIRDGEYHYSVKFRSFASSAQDIADVYFKSGERMLQIKDVAKVVERPAPRTGLDLSNGEEAVVLAIIKQSEARMSNLKRSISEQLKEFSKDYPQLRFTLTRDQTELLEYSINNLMLNIILAILLDCIIIFLFMKDLRSPLLVSLTIPISLIISFFVFYAIGLTINIISLSGLILGVGMMVDNTIVLTDNITGRWLKGEELRTSVVQGTKEVSGAMLSSVLTTCAVFIPLVFLNGLAGELFYDQAMAITVVLLVSYLVTVIVIPVYYWALHKKLPTFQPNKFLSKMHFAGAMRFYDRTVGYFLHHKWLAWGIPAICLAVIALCMAEMPKEKLPPITYTDTVLNIDWNEQISLEQNSSRVSALERSIADRCLQTTAMIGTQQFVLSHSGDQSVSEASLYVKCGSARELDDVRSMMSSFLEGHYPDAIRSYSSSGNIFDMVFSDKEPQLAARLQPSGDEDMNVENLSTALEGIRKAVPDVGIADIPLKEDVVYISDPEKMSLYGVGFNDLVNVLRNSLNGNTVFEIVQGNRSVPVVLGTDVQDMQDILSKTFIKTDDADIPVSAVMKQNYERGFKTLVSGDEGNYYQVSMDLPSSKVKATMASVDKAVRDDGKFGVEFTGSFFSNRTLMRQMFIILLIALALLFLILASQFESLVQPFIILSEVVIDIAASLALIWALGVSINIMTLIGLVVICGIVINDSILKIDTINRLVRQGDDLEAAIHEAGHRRLKAIIMTSLTTILSVAPFLTRGNMGDDLQYPMALVIIIGMTVGTFVSLFFIPSVYYAVYKHRH